MRRVLIATLALAATTGALARQNAPTPPPAADAAPATTRAEGIIDAWHDAGDRSVLVVAHRAAHAPTAHNPAGLPENSLPAIEAAIAMGCDMVELDVRATADGVLVLMHDAAIDRTTTGSGYLHRMEAADLADLRLRAADGSPTDHAIPTLEEALRACRGRIMVNVDAKVGPAVAGALDMAERLGMAGHVVVKGRVAPHLLPDWLGELDASHLLESQGPPTASFMPIAAFADQTQEAAVGQLDALLAQGPGGRWAAVEVVLDGKPAGDRLMGPIARALDGRCRLWFNALWDSIAGGRADDRTDPDAAWDWMLDHGATVIQTDRPEALLRHLRARGLRR